MKRTSTLAIPLVIGDIAALYAALFVTLLIRYSGGWYAEFIGRHALPFTVIFALWIVVFYIAGLYDLRRLRNNLDFFKTLSLTIIVNAALAVGFFYLIPGLGIAPKTNLFVVLVLFALLETWWRRSFNRARAATQPASNIVVIGAGPAATELCEFLEQNQQLGVRVHTWFKEATPPDHLATIGDWRSFIGANHIDTIVVPRDLKRETKLAAIFFELMTLGVEIRDIPSFYELVFRKVPLSEVNEEWFLEHIPRQQRFYDGLKRAGEFLFALLLGIVLLPLEFVIALAVALTSQGPVIYRQRRIGQNGRAFTLYKFRTMRTDAEKKGPQWARFKDDRTTAVGRLLRYSHLDELPQLANIIRGNLSFVGPRPERPEFVPALREKVPFYDIRHLIKPGVTGWAQLNHSYGTSDADTYQKLQYDVYYLENRSAILDIAIILKTLRSLFINHE
jgi:exopolysaccharide biosynthesis polyprenyl glycosylphosphotransferase